MTNRPLRSHTFMPAQRWDTSYLINTWSGRYERYIGLEYVPIADLVVKITVAPIHVPLELATA
jgi:hypothetical protein